MFRLSKQLKPICQSVSTIGNRRFANARFMSTNDKSTAEGEAVPEEATPVEKSEAEVVSSLQSEVKNLKDQLLRAYAEGENIRRIAHRDVENARTYANTSFAKAMLEIADDVERALSVVPADQKKALNETNQTDKTLLTLVSGLEMSEKNLQKIFHRFGVVKYGAVDDKFDPNIHEALYRIPDNDKPDTVGQIVKMGYKINDRVLRPAQIGARVKPE